MPKSHVFFIGLAIYNFLANYNVKVEADVVDMYTGQIIDIAKNNTGQACDNLGNEQHEP
ncbi:MAG: hypothetical protein QM642_09145 [Edaphocola sp.]